MDNQRSEAAQAVGPASLMAGGAGHGSAGGVLSGVAEQMDGNTSGINDAIGAIRLITDRLRGAEPPRETAGTLSKAAPDSSAEIHRLHEANGRQNNAVNQLHDAINELRNVLGY